MYMYPVIIRVHSGVTCPLLTSSGNVLVNSSDHAFGSSVQVSCEEGFKFEHSDVTVYNVTCQINGRWSLNVPHCTGMQTHALF